jgi:predicted outer membrane repeat protein
MNISFKVLIVVFLTFFASIISATIINVPGDQPTIQAGINVAVDGDTVLVQPGTYFENIDYIGKNITVASLFLTTQDTTYISQTLIDGNQNGSVVTFESGEDSTAVLCGFTLTNGHDNYGGGIYCSNSDPTLENITISNNSALYGGGFFSEFNSNPILNNVIISDNNASYGGGIYSEFSNLTIVNSTISNNYAAVFGGGIDVNATYNLMAINTNISNNYAAEYGGGIYSHGSSLELESISITDNFATNYGGGIYFYLNPANYLNFHTENRCSIYLNNSDGTRLVGKDIYYDSWGYPSTISVVVDTFTVFNPTSYYAYPTSHLTFDILNSAHELINADLYVSPAGDNTNSGLNENEPLLTIQYALSQIYADSLNECTIHLAPGIYSPQSNGEFFPIDLLDHISLCGTSEEETILDANSTGSVIRLLQQENAGTISNLTIRNGSAGSGGGIHCVYSNPFLENITIANNTVSSCGSGIYCYHSNPNLENVTISDNIASSDTLYISGAGMYCSDSNPTLDNCSIINNSATYDGGGIYCIFSNPVITNTSIINNSASRIGGGISCRSSSPILENSIVSDNSALYIGGGIYSHGSTLELTRVSITANVSSSNGGGIYLNSSDLIADNITISYNYASNGGGGIYCFSSHPYLVNSILWNDYPNEVYFFDQGFTNTITVSYSDIQGGENGIVTNNNGTVNWLLGNIDEDPLFVDAANGDYHLTANSPCIDAGDPSSPLDPDGTIADMGAYYFDQNVRMEDFELQAVKYSLSNYPNPFNPQTTINFQLPDNGEVNLSIYNIKGQKVKTIVNEKLEQGLHQIIWDGKNDNNQYVASGVYFYKLKVNNKNIAIKKCLLLK